MAGVQSPVESKRYSSSQRNDSHIPYDKEHSVQQRKTKEYIIPTLIKEGAKGQTNGRHFWLLVVTKSFGNYQKSFGSYCCPFTFNLKSIWQPIEVSRGLLFLESIGTFFQNESADFTTNSCQKFSNTNESNRHIIEQMLIELVVRYFMGFKSMRNVKAPGLDRLKIDIDTQSA